mgnify:CR=1 FL=1
MWGFNGEYFGKSSFALAIELTLMYSVDQVTSTLLSTWG